MHSFSNVLSRFRLMKYEYEQSNVLALEIQILFLESSRLIKLNKHWGMLPQHGLSPKHSLVGECMLGIIIYHWWNVCYHRRLPVQSLYDHQTVVSFSKSQCSSINSLSWWRKHEWAVKNTLWNKCIIIFRKPTPLGKLLTTIQYRQKYVKVEARTMTCFISYSYL